MAINTNKPMLVGEGALWMSEGPNKPLKFLGCHTLGDISRPRGDLNLIYCPDPGEPNKWDVVHSYQSAPGPVTTSLMTDLLPFKDFLEEIEDSGLAQALYVNMVTRGKKNVYSNYDRVFILPNFRVTSETLTKLASRTPDDQDRSEQSYEISAENLYRFFSTTAARQTVTETAALNVVRYYDRRVGNNIIKDTYGYKTGDARSGQTARVWKTSDKGDTWTATGADPFAANEHIIAMDIFEMDKTVSRLLVVRGTADAGNPMEIAYSDDEGDTWTAVNVGSALGQHPFTPYSLYVLDRYNIWLCCRDGFIYNSTDAGATWTAQESGSLTTQHLNSVFFVDDRNGWAGGDNNAILRTSDSGITWELVTGPSGKSSDDITVVSVHDYYRIWLSYDDAELWYSEDRGDTWAHRTFQYSSTGSIDAMDWMNNYIGMVVHNNAYLTSFGRVLVTTNGGTTWEEVASVPTANQGINFVKMLTPTLAHAVGEVLGTTGLLLNITGG